MQKSLCFFVFIKSEYEMLKGFTSLYHGWYVLQQLLNKFITKFNT